MNLMSEKTAVVNARAVPTNHWMIRDWNACNSLFISAMSVLTACTSVLTASNCASIRIDHAGHVSSPTIEWPVTAFALHRVSAPPG
jgi:hypothetical protein